MKKIKLIFVCMLFFVIAIAVTRCNDSENINSTNQNFNEFDVPDEKVHLMIREYVKITPKVGDPYYQWKHTGNFTCGDSSWFPLGLLDSALTPPASRYESDDLVETQHFQFLYDSYALCRSNDWAAYWHVYRFIPGSPPSETYYLNDYYELLNGTPCFPGFSINYQDDLNNVTLPDNTYIRVRIGMTVATGGDN